MPFQGGLATGLTAREVPGLKLAWGIRCSRHVGGVRPATIAGGRVFLGVDTGYVYALDALSGCVHWSYAARAGVRSAVVVGRLGKTSPARYAAYFGDIRGRVYAVDAVSGELLWTAVADDHPTARVSGAAKLQRAACTSPWRRWKRAGREPGLPVLLLSRQRRRIRCPDGTADLEDLHHCGDARRQRAAEFRRHVAARSFRRRRLGFTDLGFARSGAVCRHR